MESHVAIVWTIDPKIPIPLWWALAIAAVLVILAYALRRDHPLSHWRRWVVTLLMGLGILGPLVIVLNPTYVQTIPPSQGRALVSILVDGTSSMRTEDAAKEEKQSRWHRALELAQQLQGGNTTFELELIGFGEDVQTIASSEEEFAELKTLEGWPTGHRSDLASAIRHVIRQSKSQQHSVLLISDGAHNATSSETVLQVSREAKALATPISTVTLGTSLGMKNVSVTAKASRMIAFPDAPLHLRVQLTQNELQGRMAQLKLLRDDVVIDEQKIRLTNALQQEARFVVPKGIQNAIDHFRVVVDPIEDEVTQGDNATSILVQKVTDPIRVLVLEGKPYWDSKFLTRNLAQDTVIDLTSMIQMSSSRFLFRSSHGDAKERAKATNATASDPNVTVVSDATWKVESENASPLESESLLASYRVIVLGRDSQSFLTPNAIANLKSWISQSGGCLLCSRGLPTDAMSSAFLELLPVRWTPSAESRVRAEVSPYGVDSTILEPLLSENMDPIQTLPSLAIGATPHRKAGLPQILLQGVSSNQNATIPIVTYQPIGNGMSIVVEGAGMWRWAFLPPDHASKDKIYSTLWQSLMQWIISQQEILPGQEVSLRPDRATFLSGDPASATIIRRETTEKNPGWHVMIQSSEDPIPKRIDLLPVGQEGQLFRASFGSLGVGYYSIQLLQSSDDHVLASSAFEVRDPWFENLEVDANPDLMARVSHLSGGDIVAPNDVVEWIEGLEKKRNSQRSIRELKTTVWDRPWVLVIILLGWMGSWFFRRQNGLV